ncbi:MAG: cell division protein FtsK [Acidobacteria bacterium]|nr:MAG: cell division protein FtsK [Acidobacteriota bacterium]
MASSTRSRQLAEFLGLSSFALALMLLISLATYNPGDPAPFFKAGASGPARNFIGPIGAFLAELLVPQLFGMAALLLPLVLGVTGWKLFWCKPIDAPYTKACGVSALLLSLCAFLALTFGALTVEGESVRAGGATGALLAAVLTSSFNRTGAYIVVATCLFVSLILSTQFSFATFLSALGAAVGSRLQALRAAWAHFLDTRRKEKMRREVIKKHTKEREATGSDSLPRVRKVKGSPAGESEELVDLPLRAGAAPAQWPLPFASPEPDLKDDDEAAEPREPKRKKPAPAATVRGNFVLPPASILDEPRTSGTLDKARLFEKAKTLQAKSGEFGVMGNVVEIHPGPVVTTYEFKPDAGVKYSKIVGLADDLALALEAESIRIDRMSGRGTVGIEIPNEVRETIYLREIVESDAFRNPISRLTLGLGKTVSGDTYVTDLTAMPHLLIAGSTGTGKSVGLNCMIASILLKATPDEVRMILIDPKRLELGVYEDIPHLLTPVVTDPKIASNVLKWAVTEMERRIRRLASEGVRNIEQFNNLVRAEGGDRTPAPGSNGEEEELKPLHYIVIVIDELADLMMVSSHEVEEAITRLAQMARAVGIHLILATQRPSVDVLTGLIKANFPSRISFRVAARVDSRTILDSIGAEHLLGKGDMLFLPPGSARLLRIHGAYVTESEIARLTSYLRKTGKPAFDESVGKIERTTESAEVDEKDELFDEAARFVVSNGQASTSMLQRRFRIGFSRAGRLVDMMEREGIVGPADGSKPREILVAADYYETVDHWPK